MGGLEFGKFKLETKFAVTLGLMIFVWYLIQTGAIDPIQVYTDVVNSINKFLNKH